jgi:hypothetical protein
VNAFARDMRGDSRARHLAPISALVAAGTAGGAAALSEHPMVLEVAWIAAALGATSMLAGWRGVFPHDRRVEAAAIVMLAALAAAIAISGGADPGAAVAVAAALGTWGLCGLAHVSGLLAHVLPNRVSWKEGFAVALAAVAASLAIGAAAERPLVGALPMLYPLRTLAAPPRSARDTRRVGLVELAWMIAIAVLAVALS